MSNRPVLLVIGGGAAGFFCAINAARLNPSLSVTLLEKTNKLLSKDKVSGGGRCNVTHACFQVSAMIDKYPRGAQFLRKSFGHFFTTDTVNWFDERGVKLKTEEDGRMFPVTNSSQTIIDCLIKEANRYKVEILMNRDVKSLLQKDGRWLLTTIDGKNMEADFVCLASGGGPKLASYEWFKNLGLAVVSPVPSLFTFNIPGHPITKLMGVSVEQATVRIVGSKLVQEGPVLVTHWGLSGPAVLKLSAWGARDLADLNYHFSVGVNWCNKNENLVREIMQQWRQDSGSQKILNRNPFQLPQRLWEHLLQQAGIDEQLRWAEVPGKLQNKLISYLTNYEFAVKGKTTFKEEFVTAGGVDLKQVDPATMACRLHPNLFFAGEIMDVDGVTGGFNFQHAWTSGFLAAKEIARISMETRD